MVAYKVYWILQALELQCAWVPGWLAKKEHIQFKYFVHYAAIEQGIHSAGRIQWTLYAGKWGNHFHCAKHSPIQARHGQAMNWLITYTLTCIPLQCWHGSLISNSPYFCWKILYVFQPKGILIYTGSVFFKMFILHQFNERYFIPIYIMKIAFFHSPEIVGPPLSWESVQWCPL